MRCFVIILPVSEHLRHQLPENYANEEVHILKRDILACILTMVELERRPDSREVVQNDRFPGVLVCVSPAATFQGLPEYRRGRRFLSIILLCVLLDLLSLVSVNMAHTSNKAIEIRKGYDYSSSNPVLFLGENVIFYFSVLHLSSS